MTMIANQALVLFQGDSITDAGRQESSDGMGFGYASLTAAWFAALYPEKKVRFINRGISGNRAADLEQRWHEDCLNLRPNWVSILIGINDVWRRYDSNDPTLLETFEAHYRAILRPVAPARLILLEPFVLPVPPDRAHWREDLNPKIDVVRSLAREFNAIYVPLDGLFAQASAQAAPGFWAEDGVHPTMAGHALIAQAWLKAVKAI